MAAFSRILLKLSGELLRSSDECFSPVQLRAVADALKRTVQSGVQTAVVVGGGNIFRGREVAAERFRTDADHVGMLATLLNAGMLRFYLQEAGVRARVFAPRAVPPVAEAFERSAAVAALERGEVVLLGGGTGNPCFSTDSAAALRAIELAADAVLKGTLVDGVYDKDPRRHPDARRYESLTFDEVLQRQLRVMDQTAIALCREYGMKVVVFDLTEPLNLLRVVEGSLAGSVIHG
jgi:uridylate kinase